MERIEFLTSGEGKALISEIQKLSEECNFQWYKVSLALSKRFKNHNPSSVRSAYEVVQARRSALPYGDWTTEGLFTVQGVQQSTHPDIASYHALSFFGCSRVLEVCGGLGFDTAALARVSSHVTSLEADPETAAMLEYNLALQGISNVEVRSERMEEFLTSTSLDFDAFWSDPSRRNEKGERVRDTDLYSPSLSSLLTAFPENKLLGVKVAPRAHVDESGLSREWIGMGGECREQILWRCLDKPNGLVTLVDKGGQWYPKPQEFVDEYQYPKKYKFLVEPHNALIASGWLSEFFAENSLVPLDPKIAYAVSEEEPAESPFYSRFRVLSQEVPNLRQLTQRLKELGWGKETEIKKRGYPQEPDQLRAKLKFPDSREKGVLFFTRQGTKNIVVVATRI